MEKTKDWHAQRNVDDFFYICSQSIIDHFIQNSEVKAISRSFLGSLNV